MRIQRLRVTVTACWNGHHNYFLVGYISRGNGFISACRIRSDHWGRKEATEALDVLEGVYGLERRKIRFRHV